MNLPRLKPTVALLIIWACAMPSMAHAATVLWPVTLSSGASLPNVPVTVKPLGIYTNGLGGYATKDLLYFTTDTNGLATLTNLTTGSFTLSVTGPYTVTPITITVSNYASTYYVANITTVPTNNGGVMAYSTVASDLRYVQPANIIAGANVTAVTNGLNVTLSSTSSGSGSQTPLTANVNAAGFSLTNLSGLQSKFETNLTLLNSNTITGSNATFFTVTASNGFTGNLIGNASGTAASVTGSFTGDVTGLQGANVVSTVGTSTAANIHSAELSANAATTNHTASTIVLRDAQGNIYAAHLVQFTVIPTNLYTPSQTFSYVGNGGELIGNNILTASSPIFDVNSHDGFGEDDSITFNGNEQYFVNQVIDSTHAYMTPPFSSTQTSIHGVVSPKAGSFLDNNANFVGADINNGGMYRGPIWGNNYLGLIDQPRSNSWFITSGNKGNGFGINFLSFRSVYNWKDVLNIASDGLANTLDILPDGTLSVRVGLTNIFNNPIVIQPGLTVPQTSKLNTVTAMTVVATNGFTGPASGLTSIPGANITAGTINSNSLDAATKAQLALAGTGGGTAITALTGDVTASGTGSVAATVALVDGSSAANVHAAELLANAATSANTASAIAKRDANGVIIANLNGAATTATNFSGSLSGDVTGTQGSTVVATVGGATAANVATATSVANGATSANTASKIVARDGSGNFSAGTITAALTGNASGSAASFTGSLVGNVTGTQGATVVSSVGSAALPAGQLTGSLTDARLSANVPLLNSSPVFTTPVTAASFTGNGQGLTNVVNLGYTNTPALVASTNTTVTFGGVLYSSFINPSGNICFNNFTGTQNAISYGIIGTKLVLWPTNLHTLGNTNGLTLNGTNWQYQCTNALAISFWALTNLQNNSQFTNILCSFSGN